MTVLACLLTAGAMAQVQRQVTTLNREPVVTLGQEADNANPRKGNANKMALKELGLSKQQKQQLREMRQSNILRKEAITTDKQLSAEQKKQALQSMKRSSAASLQGILTTSQLATLNEMRSKGVFAELE